MRSQASCRSCPRRRGARCQAVSRRAQRRTAPWGQPQRRPGLASRSCRRWGPRPQPSLCPAILQASPRAAATRTIAPLPRGSPARCPTRRRPLLLLTRYGTSGACYGAASSTTSACTLANRCFSSASSSTWGRSSQRRGVRSRQSASPPFATYPSPPPIRRRRQAWAPWASCASSFHTTRSCTRTSPTRRSSRAPWRTPRRRTAGRDRWCSRPSNARRGTASAPPSASALPSRPWTTASRCSCAPTPLRAAWALSSLWARTFCHTRATRPASRPPSGGTPSRSLKRSRGSTYFIAFTRCCEAPAASSGSATT